MTAARVLSLLFVVALGCEVVSPDEEPVRESRATLGESCGLGNSCQPGEFCVRSVCCDSPCAGPCDACGPEDQATMDPGHCGPAKTGTQCGKYCMLGAQAVGACDGAETCILTPKSCNGYACKETACLTSCTLQTDCAPDFSCREDQCLPLLDDGEPCQDDSYCRNHFCVEGVCCDKPCNILCGSCLGKHNELGKDGVCLPVLEGKDPNADCDEQPTAGCQQNGLCNGVFGCALWSDDTACGATTCTENAGSEATVEGFLCESGQCLQKSETCAGYVTCNFDGRCPVTCVDSSDCAEGYDCYDVPDDDNPTKQCRLMVGTCTDTVTLKGLDGVSTSCLPFLCVAGQCLDSCSSNAQCGPGFLCDGASGKCLSATAPDEAEPPGCASCTVGESSSGSGLFFVLTALLWGLRLSTRDASSRKSMRAILRKSRELRCRTRSHERSRFTQGATRLPTRVDTRD